MNMICCSVKMYNHFPGPCSPPVVSIRKIHFSGVRWKIILIPLYKWFENQRHVPYNMLFIYVIFFRNWKGIAFGKTIIKRDSSSSFCKLETKKKPYHVNFYRTAKDKIRYGLRRSESRDWKTHMANMLYTLVLFKSKNKSKLKL